jgi:hypothetical protein
LVVITTDGYFQEALMVSEAARMLVTFFIAAYLILLSAPAFAQSVNVDAAKKEGKVVIMARSCRR